MGNPKTGEIRNLHNWIFGLQVRYSDFEFEVNGVL